MVSSLIPPKISHPSMVAGGKGGEPSFLSYMYSRLPKGSLPVRERFARPGVARWFQHPDVGGKPFLVFLGAGMLFGYTMHYQRHFKHEKKSLH